MNVREWALPVYTILTQIAAGTLLLLWGLRALTLRRISSAEWDAMMRRPILVIIVTLVIGMIGAHFHLSKPWISFLAIVNVGSSWLSREIVFTVAMFVACTLLAYLIWFDRSDRQRVKTFLGWLGVLCGGAMLFCMGRIYQLPTQAPWRHWTVVPLFLASSLVLGTLSTAALLTLDGVFEQSGERSLSVGRWYLTRYAMLRLVLAATLGLIIILVLNAVQISVSRSGDALMQASLSLLLELYLSLFWLRLVLLTVGCIGFAIIALHWLRRNRAIEDLVKPVYAACLLVLTAEILGRFLFYATHVRLGL